MARRADGGNIAVPTITIDGKHDPFGFTAS
jgi:hypothetical protein